MRSGNAKEKVELEIDMDVTAVSPEQVSHISR